LYLSDSNLLENRFLQEKQISSKPIKSYSGYFVTVYFLIAPRRMGVNLNGVNSIINPIVDPATNFACNFLRAIYLKHLIKNILYIY